MTNTECDQIRTGVARNLPESHKITVAKLLSRGNIQFCLGVAFASSTLLWRQASSGQQVLLLEDLIFQQEIFIKKPRIHLGIWYLI
jgi:hypothetical protein